MTVETPSRLHFSMIDMRGDLGRIHGSVGVAIDSPRIALKAKKAPSIDVKGPRAGRVKAFAETLLAGSGISGGASIEVLSDIMEHSGFGSGTQLALAVGTALSELYGLSLTAEEIASRLNRSRRSGIGTYAFKHGGFIVDGGHRTDRKMGTPPLLFRADIPESWRFVIGVPKIPTMKSGSAESNAFKRLDPPPATLIGEISRIILLQMIPAIIEEDIVSFGEAMTSVDFRFGEFWIEIQGGRFTHPLIEEGIGFLAENGALGVGQSSWGPGFYGLAEGGAQARKICGDLERYLNEDGRRGRAFVAGPDNHGAVVTKTGI
ncbi:MAG: beta-ribofuranosylaminobenzene 5'-phosphate synthase family protein [Candidatus Bathyarchaeia archaeon]